MTIDIHQTSAKQFLIVFLLLVGAALGTIWLWVVMEPLAYQDGIYPTWLARMQLVEQNQVGSLPILGDSGAGADLIPSLIGPGVVDLALGGGTPIESLYFARKIVASPTPPKAVIISITPYRFIKAEFFWGSSVGYHLLSLQDIDELRRTSRSLKDDSLFGAESPGDVDARLKLNLYAISFPSFYLPALIGSRFYQRYDGNVASLNKIIANRGHLYYGLKEGSTEPDQEVSLTGFVPTKILDNSFDKTLALFQSHHIPVYFIAMPHNAASVPLYRPGLKEAFADYLNQYAARYPGFHILGEPMPVYPSEYFGDALHLNKKGAALWSAYVRQLLNDSHVEGGPFVAN